MLHFMVRNLDKLHNSNEETAHNAIITYVYAILQSQHCNSEMYISDTKYTFHEFMPINTAKSAFLHKCWDSILGVIVYLNKAKQSSQDVSPHICFHS